MSDIRSVSIFDSASAATAGSAPSPGPMVMAAAQAAPCVKSSSTVANFLSVPPATATTITPITEHGQSQLAGKHKADDSGEEPESKQMKDRD
ncbi:hypothetical protein C0995_000956 [Termitomyces sp. Mi166|nr:hypothetical protein C0995_000956 [Termitomyces sp. Mi166\